MSRKTVTWTEGGFMEETYDQRLWHTSSGSVKKDKLSFLPVCFRLCTKAKRNRKTAQSLKKQYLLPSLGLQCVFAERELQNICWPVWKKVEKQEHTVNAGVRGYTCFLGRPLNSSSNCSASWAPGGSSLFTQKAVEEVSQHSLIGSPCCRRIRAETGFNCHNNDETELCFLLTKLLIDRLFYFHPESYNDAN